MASRFPWLRLVSAANSVWVGVSIEEPLHFDFTLPHTHPAANTTLEYDNGERFDLRLPYADQGYVDEDADVMGKLFGKKKAKAAPKEDEEAEPKKGPFGLW